MGICRHCGGWVDEGDICSCGGSGGNNDDDLINTGKSEEDYYFKKAVEYSINGKHQQAIEFYKKAKDPFKKMYIAREYEEMGDYYTALEYWNDFCSWNNGLKGFNGKANLLYKMKRYNDAIIFYKKALEASENSIFQKSDLTSYNLNLSISKCYKKLIDKENAEIYRYRADKHIKKYVNECIVLGRKYFINGDYSNAQYFYRIALKYDCDNKVLQKKFADCGGDLAFENSRNYSEKAWEYYNDFKDKDALHYINLSLECDDSNAENWNKKAIILEGMKNYKESLKCYDKSLLLMYKPLVCDNKARMLYDWANKLFNDSKNMKFPFGTLEEAKTYCIMALNTLPGENSEEHIDKYIELKNSINFYINSIYDKDKLFTITGTQYNGNVKLTPHMPLKLVKETDNKFDSDAIAIFSGYKKIGYVANNENTKSDLTSSASQLQDKFQKIISGEYLGDIKQNDLIIFHIGKINK